MSPEPPPWLPIEVIGKHRILHMDIIATKASDPAFLKSPQHLGIQTPVVKRFGDRKRIVRAMAGLETAIHEFRLPFHKWKTAFGMGTFPLVKKVPAVNLSSRIRAGFVGAKCS